MNEVGSGINKNTVDESFHAQDSMKNDAVILYAEDNKINQKIVKTFLEDKGFKCLCAINCDEALLIFEGKNVDLIFMDVQMPVLNGFLATRIIRDREKNSNRHIPIIAMTAYAMNGDKEKCIDAGMDDYISKPANLNELLVKVQRLLQV